MVKALNDINLKEDENWWIPKDPIQYINSEYEIT